MAAAYRKRVDLIDALLEAGPKLDVFECAAVGDTEAITEILEEKPGLVGAIARDGYTALHLAAFFGHFETMRRLIDRGAEVNAIATNPSQVQPLHSACAGGNLDCVASLLRRGANPNARQQKGFTALHAAAQQANGPMVQILLDFDADPTLANEAGQKPEALTDDAEVLGLLRAARS
jgi:ankyrin repeat protein